MFSQTSPDKSDRQESDRTLDDLVPKAAQVLFINIIEHSKRRMSEQRKVVHQIARRVMDCADPDHMSLSKTYADYVIQLGDGTEYLRDLAECEVNYGLTLHLFNFCDGQIGNLPTPTNCFEMTWNRHLLE